MRAAGEILRALSAEPANAELRARTIGALFLLGGLLGALSVALPENVDHEGLIWAFAALAAGVGAAVMALGGRLGEPAAHGFVALGVVLINLVTLASGIASLVYAVMFFWLASGGAFFFTRRAMLLHIAWALAGYAVVLVLLPDSPGYSGVTRWLLLAFSLTVCGLLVSTVFERLSRSEVARRTFFSIARDMLAIADSQGCFTDTNGRWSEVLGYSFEELRAGPFPRLLLPEDRATARSAIESAAKGRVAQWDARVRGKDEDIHWLRWSCVPADGGDVLYVSATDVTDRHRASEQREELLHELDVQAREDPLTGLPNRRWLHHEMQREIERATRQGFEMCTAMIDIDHFKRYNDSLGHLEGDRFLVEASGRWRSQLRAVDFLARYGGEEFVAILPACDLVEAERVMQRLRSATPMGQSCSIGIAMWQPSESENDVIGRADRAMYAAKAAGRDRVVLDAGGEVVTPDE